MGKTKLGAITIGQSPRSDITPDISGILEPHLELVECGALDNFTYEEVVKKFAPIAGEVSFVSRMRDGRQVELSRSKLLPFIQDCIVKLEAMQCQTIVMFCTGEFPPFKHHVPLIEPCSLLQNIIRGIVGQGPIGILVPTADQIEGIKNRWSNFGIETVLVAASPYDSIEKIKQAVTRFKKDDIELIFLNCIGYSVAMKEIVRETTGCSVMLPRTTIARMMLEIYQ